MLRNLSLQANGSECNVRCVMCVDNAEEPEGPVERHPLVLQDVHEAALGAVLEQDEYIPRLHSPAHKAADVGVIETPATT